MPVTMLEKVFKDKYGGVYMLSVIVPAYNEELSIEKAIKKFYSYERIGVSTRFTLRKIAKVV